MSKAGELLKVSEAGQEFVFIWKNEKTFAREKNSPTVKFFADSLFRVQKGIEGSGDKSFAIVKLSGDAISQSLVGFTEVKTFTVTVSPG